MMPGLFLLPYKRELSLREHSRCLSKVRITGVQFLLVSRGGVMGTCKGHRCIATSWSNKGLIARRAILFARSLCVKHKECSCRL
jgi:hypothetical protein